MKIDTLMGRDVDTIDFANPLHANLYTAAYTYQRIAKSLKERCQRAIDELTFTMQQCDEMQKGEACLVNSCGVLQGLGLQIDMDCATVRMAYDHLQEAKVLAK